jgi:hypothetical protein
MIFRLFMNLKSHCMTGRDRVINALNFRKTDRVPVDLGGTCCSGAHVSIISKLRQALGLSSDAVKVIDPYQMLGEVAPDLQELLGIDITLLHTPRNMFGFANSDWKPWTLQDGTKVLVPGKFNTTPDKDGNLLQYPQGDHSAPPSGKMPRNGFYFDTIIRQNPINDSNLNPSDNLEEFTLLNDADLKYYEQQADYLFKKTNLAIVIAAPGTAFGDAALIPAPFLKYPKGIRDIEEWYVSTVLRKDYITQVFAAQAEIAVKNLGMLYQAVGEKIQIIWMDGTDLASQNSLFCSPDTYNELYLPHAKKVNDWIHAHTKWKTIKHCCGACEPLIKNFINAGYDILNPVQCSAKGMEPQKLVDKYGGRIVFWGGGVDTQNTLPFGTSQEVYKQVSERVNIFNQKSGFVFNTIHNIQANTPIDNVLAMFAALGRKFVI